MATVKSDPFTGCTAGAGSSSPPALAGLAPGRYEIDTGRSGVTFRTRHLFGLSPVRGGFTIRAGMVEVAEPAADSRVHVEIETGSFHTGNPKRDGTVRSARLLDAGQHPVMTFISDHVESPALAGLLTVRDITRPVSLLVERVAIAPGSFTARGTMRIDRADFGVTAYRGLAGRCLDMTAEVRCVRQ
jgi:polyisoprenoid-binding protein YceI